jgi:hypothetical protein
MNQTVTLHTPSLLGKRVVDVRRPIVEDIPTCVSRLIDSCCQSDPAARLPDMPAVIERIELARAILARQAAEPVSLAEFSNESEEMAPVDVDSDPFSGADEVGWPADPPLPNIP